jgi:hypothetical protein
MMNKYIRSEQMSSKQMPNHCMGSDYVRSKDISSNSTSSKQMISDYMGSNYAHTESAAS